MPPLVLVQVASLSPDIYGFLDTSPEPIRFFIQDFNIVPINVVASIGMFIYRVDGPLLEFIAFMLTTYSFHKRGKYPPLMTINKMWHSQCQKVILDKADSYFIYKRKQKTKHNKQTNEVAGIVFHWFTFLLTLLYSQQIWNELFTKLNWQS